MKTKANTTGWPIVLLAMTAAVGGQAAWSQVIETNDDTGNPSCTLSYNNPSCWDIGVVPNNGATSYAVTIDDGLPIGLIQSATVNRLTIGAGSRLDIGNFRSLTIPGDSGSGDRGLLTLDGTLNLGSTGSNTSLQLLDAYTILTSGSLAPPGSDSITSSSNNRNSIVGAGNAPEALLNNQSVRFTGVVGSFDRLEFRNGRVSPNLGTSLEFNSIGSLETSATTFSADGAGTTLRFSGLSYDGNSTTEVTASNGGTVEIVDVFATALQFRNDFGEIKIRRSSIENSNLIFGGLVVFEGANNRLASSNVIDVDNAELRLSNGSVTSIEAGANIALRNGASLVADSTGTNTILSIEGNGGDAVTFDSLALTGSDSISSSSNNRNSIVGAGIAPEALLTNQSIGFTGLIGSFDRLEFRNGRVSPNLGTSLEFNSIGSLETSATTFSADGAGTTLRFSGLSYDGNSTTEVTASNGGTVEIVDVFATALQFRNDFGEIKIRRSSIENSNLIFGGLVVFEGANNRLASSNVIDVDNAELRLSNGSVTSIEAGANIALRNGASLVADSTGTNTILNIEGNGGDAVVLSKGNAAAANPAFSLSDTANNAVRGTGSAPRLNFDSVDIRGAGRLDSLDRLAIVGAVFENSAGKTLSLADVDQVDADEALFRSAFGGGSISVTRVNLDGNGTSQIEASGGGAFLADNSNLFNISATARQGSTLDFNAATINNSFLGTEGNGQISLRDTELSQVELSGNVQVGGEFRLGTGVTYDTLVTDPTRATTITAADGVSIDNRIKYELPAGGGLFGRLASESPVLAINSRVSGVFSVESTTAIGSTGSFEFEGAGIGSINAPIRNDGSITLDNNVEVFINDQVTGGSGQWNIDGGRIRANASILGSGDWTITNNGTVDIGANLNLDAQSFNLSNGALFLNGGKLTSDTFLTGEESEVVVLSTISTRNLSIAMTNEAAWNLDETTVIEMRGGEGAVIGDWSDWGVLEIAGLDQGDDPGGFLDNFEIPTLEIGAGASVFLRDLLDNGNRGGSGGQPEALYVDTLVFQDGFSVLNLNGLNLYFNNLVGEESQIINQVVPVPPAIWLFGSALAGLGWLRRRRGCA